MSLFVSSQSAVQQPGVFPIEVAPPTVIEGVSNGYIGYAFQGEWGPVKTVYQPTSQGDLINKFFPAGTPHTSTGYYGIMRRAAFTSKLVRILGGPEGLLPPLNVTITQHGTPGAAAVAYRVDARNAAGATMASALFSTATANATLGSSNYNVVTWSSVVGAITYDLYRVSGGASQGLIVNQAGVTYNDQGAAGDSTTAPTANTTGWKAACAILTASGAPVARLTCISPGAGPNTLLTAQVLSASDGNAAHFDLVLNLASAATGTTTERFPNLELPAAAIVPNVSTARLLGNFEIIGTPVANPDAATYSFSGGSDGAAVTHTDYNAALALFRLDPEIRVVTVDDCGDSIRAAVNGDLVAHVNATTDRLCVLHGSANNTLAQVLTDVQSYVSDRVIYCGVWVKVVDDAGVAQLSPFATMIASALVNLQPQQSHAWWNEIATVYYGGIDSIYQPQFSTADDGTQGPCTQAGVCLPIRLEDGTYAALHDRVTTSVVNKRYATTRRIKDFIAKSVKNALTPFVNGPNIRDAQEDIKLATDNFLGSQIPAGRLTAVDPVDIDSQNNATTQALGQFTFVMTGRCTTPMEQIFPMVNIGPGVVGVSFS